MQKSSALIIGIGNPNMGDDAIGIEIVNEIKRQNLEVDTEVLFYISFELLDKIIGYDHVIIIDAANLGREYGEIVHLTYKDLSHSMYLKNSHGISIYHVLKTGYMVLDEDMPKELDIFLIETKEIQEVKKGINQKLKDNIPTIIEHIKEILKI